MSTLLGHFQQNQNNMRRKLLEFLFLFPPDPSRSGGAEGMIIEDERWVEGSEELPEVVVQDPEDLAHHVEIGQLLGQQPGDPTQQLLIDLILEIQRLAAGK